MNACHNRPPFAPSVRVADGWESSWARNMVDMEFRMDPNCVYSSSDLGQADKGCTGCRWRKEGSDVEVVEVVKKPGRVAKPRNPVASALADGGCDVA